MASSAREIQLNELRDTISQLKETIAEQNELIRSLRDRLDEKTNHEKQLQEQIDYLTKKLFGTSSEKRSGDIPGQQNLFDEAEVEQDPSQEEIQEETIIHEHTRKKKGTHQDFFKGMEIEKVVIPLPKEEQICPVCGTQMVFIGEEYVRRELQFIPARCKVIEYYSQNYGCPSCKQGSGDTESAVIVKSQAPKALVGKGPASASTVAWTMYQKYANGLPLYRQEKDWKQYGAKITRTTLANWVIYCSKNYFQPMYDYFHRVLLGRSFAMADETRVQVLKEEDRAAQTQSFMWLFRSGEDGLPAIILYGYSSTRSGTHAKEFLNGYHGYLETDGYQGYNALMDVKRCSCWAHIRRYFIDAVPKGKQYDYSQPAVQGIQYCNRLFAIEEAINKKHPGDYEKRKELRLKDEKPILEAFWSWVEKQKPVKNSRMDKAINYVLNRRSTAETYLEDGRCSFTNNLSENAIRPFAVGRKNWLFSDTVDGANASAVVYTIVEMAKAHDLNIYEYLKFLLEKRPSKEMTDEQFEELAPWSKQLQSIKTPHSN